MILPSVVLRMPTWALLLRFAESHSAGAHQTVRARQAGQLEYMQVQVASKDVSRVRMALVDAPHAEIVRCAPLPQEQFVRLDIAFPRGHSEAVMHRILACTDCGAFGPVRATPCGPAQSDRRGSLAGHVSAAPALHG
jgi:hypothetical protein